MYYNPHVAQGSGSTEKDRVERMQELEDGEQCCEMLFSGTRTNSSTFLLVTFARLSFKNPNHTPLFSVFSRQRQETHCEFKSVCVRSTVYVENFRSLRTMQ